MQPSKIIKSLLVLREQTYQSMADKLGKAGRSSVSSSVYRETRMRLNTLMEMADVLDAEIVVRTKDGKFEWVISDENEPKQG